MDENSSEGSTGIVPAIRKAATPGSIILAHDTGPKTRLMTINNLDAILSGLKADGFAFTKVSELCGWAAPTPHDEPGTREPRVPDDAQ